MKKFVVLMVVMGLIFGVGCAKKADNEVLPSSNRLTIDEPEQAVENQIEAEEIPSPEQSVEALEVGTSEPKVFVIPDDIKSSSYFPFMESLQDPKQFYTKMSMEFKDKGQQIKLVYKAWVDNGRSCTEMTDPRSGSNVVLINDGTQIITYNNGVRDSTVINKTARIPNFKEAESFISMPNYPKMIKLVKADKLNDVPVIYVEKEYTINGKIKWGIRSWTSLEKDIPIPQKIEFEVSEDSVIVMKMIEYKIGPVDPQKFVIKK